MERESDAFDALDLQLLAALELAGRAPFSRIAAVLGVSDQTVARRYRGLTAEAGLRVVAVRDAERLGQDQWMLRLRCTPTAPGPSRKPWPNDPTPAGSDWRRAAPRWPA